MTRLEGEQVTIGYGDNVIVDNLDVHIPTGKITSIIGPNGCGKSTLLKALSRLLPIKDGEIKLDGENLHTQSTKEVAKKLRFYHNHQKWPMDLRLESLFHMVAFHIKKDLGDFLRKIKRKLIGP